MTLRNLCQTYCVGNTLAQNYRWFRKDAIPKRGHFSRRHWEVVFCFSYFVLGGVFVYTLYCLASVTKSVLRFGMKITSNSRKMTE